MDIGLGAVDHAVHLVLVGGGEHFLGGDVGQEADPLFAAGSGALPDGAVGQAHGQVGAVGALKVDRFQVQGVHLVLQHGQTVQMGLPGPHGVAAGDAAGVEDQLPQLFHRLVFGEVGKELLRPGGGGHGRDGPLHPVVHGVAAPGHQGLAAGGVHPADLAGVQPGQGFGVAGQQAQHADAALALGVVQIAAQDVGLDVAQGLLGALFHADAGESVVRPVHPDVPGAGVEGAGRAQAGQGGGRQGRGDDEGLARLDVDADPNDEAGIFLQELFKILHSGILSFLKREWAAAPQYNPSGGRCPPPGGELFF